MTRTALFAAAALTLAACGEAPQEAPAPAEPAPAQPTPQPAPEPAPTPPALTPPAPEQASDDWRAYALPDDVNRLERLDAAWKAGLDAAAPRDVRPLGALADPKVALDRPQPTPGLYRCRTIKMGGGGLGFIAYPWFRCRIELTPGGDLTLTKLTGSQRQAGKMYPYSDTALVYLGGMALGVGEEQASAYGQAPERDQIGLVQRIGDARWRIAFPWPRVESDLDLLELVREGN